MTKVATMGTSSCATIALQGFKPEQIELNEAYKKDPSSFKEPTEMTVKDFYNKILYPTRQDLGRSDDYPFTKLMEEIVSGPLKTKFCIVTLNAYQMNDKDGYWPKELEKWGFKPFTKTRNVIGTVCTLFARNPNEVKE